MAWSNDSIHNDLILCGRLVRSLAHSVRGDLAVIQNDLTYLSGIIPPEEIERSKKRCTQASATLKKLSLLADHDSTRACASGELLELFGIQSRERHFMSGTVRVDLASIRGWLEIIGELIGPWKASAPLHDNKTTCLLIELTSPSLHDGSVEYTTWHAFAAAERGERYVLEGCLADLVMRSYGWSVYLRNNRSHVLSAIRVPVSEGVQLCER